MKPSDCPKWTQCECPLCPLDMSWRDAADKGQSAHLKGEAICPYLRLAVKNGGVDELYSSVPEHIADHIVEVLPEIMERHRDIKSKLETASRSKSKMEMARQLNRSRGSKAKSRTELNHATKRKFNSAKRRPMRSHASAERVKGDNHG